MKPCDICLEKECKAKGGRGSCNCETCSVKDTCPKKLRPTIRITQKCTQSCRHCCFSCTPQTDVHMSIETAKAVAEFNKSNEVFSINLMGGEIYCHPNWKEILDILIPSVNFCRIVSNGDWAEHGAEFAEHIAKYDHCYVSLSNDQWHTNKNIEKAKEFLIKNNVIVKVSELNEKEFSLVPVGRGEYSYGLYSSFSCYCYNPEHQYAFLIDEEGKIYKCGFGVWDYADVFEYKEGGFAERFREFNMIFYSVFIPNCSKCSISYRFSNK